MKSGTDCNHEAPKQVKHDKHIKHKGEEIKG